jgi:hypothetical protein
MIIMNKYRFFGYSFIVLLFSTLFLWSCDEYDRRSVENDFFVNHASLSMFVGDKVQLVASPTGVTNKYKWESADPLIASVSNDGLVESLAEGETMIMVSSGDLSIQIPVVSVKKIPLKSIELNNKLIIGKPGDVVTIFVTNSPEDANYIPSQKWESKDPRVALVNPNGKISLVGIGKTDIVYEVGDLKEIVKVVVTYTRPFKGPHILSKDAELYIPAANFDFGGEGYAFHDSDSANKTKSNYRKDNGDPDGAAADVEGDGTNLGYTNADEWFQYTVEVKDAGEYYFDISQSAGAGGGRYHLIIDGEKSTESVDVPNNGSWNSWRWFPSMPQVINVSEGIHEFRFYFEGGGFNLRGLRFIKK